MRLFHSLNSLVVSRNLWHVTFNCFFNLVKHTSKNSLNSKDFRAVLIFLLAIAVVEFF
jgi:hypothetical protein